MFVFLFRIETLQLASLFPVRMSISENGRTRERIVRSGQNHQPSLPQLDLRNRILSVHLPSQCQRPVQHSLGESQGGASSAVLLPETSLLTVLMYRVGALPISPLRCSVGAFLVLNLSCFFSPRSLSSLYFFCASSFENPPCTNTNLAICFSFVLASPSKFAGSGR